MPLVDTVSKWQSCFQQLKAYFDEIRKPGQYLNYFPLYTTRTYENPLANVCPTTDERIVGTKCLNILIVGYPYGWSKASGSWLFDWPGHTDYYPFKTYLMNHFPKFPRYRLLMYGDTSPATEMTTISPAAGGRLSDMLGATFGTLELECNEMASYGWQWKGILNEVPSYDYFIPELEDFYLRRSE